MIKHSIPILIFSFLIYCNSSEKQETTREDWRDQQQIWWNNPEILKNEIVALIDLSANDYSIQMKMAKYWGINGLLLLFDERDQYEDFAVISDLLSYNIGVSGMEIFSCVITRKGKKILPVLQAVLESNTNDCWKCFGDTSSKCLDPDTYHNVVKSLIRQIKEDRPCTIEQ